MQMALFNLDPPRGRRVPHTEDLWCTTGAETFGGIATRHSNNGGYTTAGEYLLTSSVYTHLAQICPTALVFYTHACLVGRFNPSGKILTNTEIIIANMGEHQTCKSNHR